MVDAVADALTAWPGLRGSVLVEGVRAASGAAYDDWGERLGTGWDVRPARPRRRARVTPRSLPSAPGEVDDVAPLFCAYLAFYGVQRSPGSAHAFLRARVAAGESLVLLARTAGGEPAAFAQVYFAFSSLSLGRVWTLNDLFVAEAARGTGLGRMLVREVCGRAAAAGAVRVQLETAVDNHAAKALYAAEGFEIERGFDRLSRRL